MDIPTTLAIELEPPTIVAILGSIWGFLASVVAGFIAYRSKKDELLFQERQTRISQRAEQAKEASVATAASAETGFKAMERTLDALELRLRDTEERCTRAETKADISAAHAAKCDRTLAYLQAVARLKGWPDENGFEHIPNIEP